MNENRNYANITTVSINSWADSRVTQVLRKSSLFSWIKGESKMLVKSYHQGEIF